jgi:hypothetical protein
MGAQIVEMVGDLITCKIWGKLSEPELHAVQRAVSAAMEGKDRVNLLVLVENFDGWERGEWADFSFQAAQDGKIARMALVGEQRWEDLATAFVGAEMRAFPISYFLPGELGQALQWLSKG